METDLQVERRKQTRPCDSLISCMCACTTWGCGVYFVRPSQPPGLLLRIIDLRPSPVCCGCAGSLAWTVRQVSLTILAPQSSQVMKHSVLGMWQEIHICLCRCDPLLQPRRRRQLRDESGRRKPRRLIENLHWGKLLSWCRRWLQVKNETMHQTLDSGSKILLPESLINANRQSWESTKHQYFVGELSKSIFSGISLSFYVFYILSCLCVDVGAFLWHISSQHLYTNIRLSTLKNRQACKWFLCCNALNVTHCSCCLKRNNFNFGVVLLNWKLYHIEEDLISSHLNLISFKTNKQTKTLAYLQNQWFH